MNKNALTITAVVVFHLVVISVMIVQPGCKSDGAKTATTPPAEAANTTVVAPDTTQWSSPTRPPDEPPPQIAQFTPATSEPATAINEIPATPPPAMSSVKYHTVKPRDNLINIAGQYGVTVDEIVAANTASGLTRTTVLQLGREIVIPEHVATAPTPAASTSADTYKVLSGENLTIIARKLNTTVPAIKAANNMTTDLVIAGQTLKIPAAGSASAPAPASTPGSAAASADEYVMQANDNPSSIAQKTGVRLDDLMRLNNLTNESARRLKPGDRLKLPPRTGAPAPASPPVTPAPVPATVTPVAAPVTLAPSSTERPPVAPVQ